MKPHILLLLLLIIIELALHRSQTFVGWSSQSHAGSILKPWMWPFDLTAHNLTTEKWQAARHMEICTPCIVCCFRQSIKYNLLPSFSPSSYFSNLCSVFLHLHLYTFITVLGIFTFCNNLVIQFTQNIYMYVSSFFMKWYCYLVPDPDSNAYQFVVRLWSVHHTMTLLIMCPYWDEGKLQTALFFLPCYGHNVYLYTWFRMITLRTTLYADVL